jgi:hypothetical protein
MASNGRGKRQIEQQVLRLDAHHALGIGGQAQVEGRQGFM